MKTFKDLVIKKMIEDVRQKYGSESKIAIDFCNICTKGKSFNLIRKKYKKLIDNNNK